MVLTDGTAQVGELRRAKVTHATEYHLVGKLLEDNPGKSSKASGKKAAKTSAVRSTRLPIVR